MRFVPYRCALLSCWPYNTTRKLIKEYLYDHYKKVVISNSYIFLVNIVHPSKTRNLEATDLRNFVPRLIIPFLLYLRREKEV